MIPFGAGGGSRRFTAAVPVTPASATGSAAAPPIVTVKIVQDIAARDAEPVHPPEDATSGTTTRTPTRNVRRPPSAPPTTPMASTSHRLEYNLRSASKSSTPESSLVANYTTPTTIATLCEVSKILPTVTSSRGNDDDESPSSLTNNQQNHMSIIKDRNGKVTGENIIDSPTTNGASKRTSTSGSSISTSSTTSTTTPTTIGATTVGTKESSDKIKIGKDPESSLEPMDATTATATTTEKMTDGQWATATPSAPAALPTSAPSKVVENSGDVSPTSPNHKSNDSKAEVKMTDVKATSSSANDMPSKVIRAVEDSSNKKKTNDDDDDDDKSSESKTNDAIHPTINKCPSPSSKGGIAKMKADDGSVPTAKTGDTSNHSDRLFAFDPNNMDDVLDLGVNEFETIIIGPTPSEYTQEDFHGARDHRGSGNEEYVYHNHHGPGEQGHYHPPMDSHRHQQYYSNPHQYPRYHAEHHPHYHHVGIVSPVTTSIMAACLTNEVPRLFSDAVARFQDEADVDGIDRATGEIVAKSLPWSPIKMRKPKKTDQKPQKKLPTDIGITVVSVKVGGVEIFEKDDDMKSQVPYHHPTDHQTVVSVLHSTPPNSPTPSVSSASMQEAVLKVREEFSNGGRYDSLGTSSFICNTNHYAGVQIYGSTPALPVPHTIIAFGTGRDRGSASRRTTSTFGVPASPDGK